jgi:hypothetical protein
MSVESFIAIVVAGILWFAYIVCVEVNKRFK